MLSLIRAGLARMEVAGAFFVTNPSGVRQSGRQSGKSGLKNTTAVEDAKDRYGIGCDQERNHRAAFETENP
jgi:hypothetical protein